MRCRGKVLLASALYLICAISVIPANAASYAGIKGCLYRGTPEWCLLVKTDRGRIYQLVRAGTFRGIRSGTQRGVEVIARGKVVQAQINVCGAPAKIKAISVTFTGRLCRP